MQTDSIGLNSVDIDFKEINYKLNDWFIISPNNNFFLIKITFSYIKDREPAAGFCLKLEATEQIMST